MLENLTTESRNAKSIKLDELPIDTIVDLMIQEEKNTDAAIQKEQAAIVAVIEATVRCFRQKGRLIYIGAGSSGRVGVLDAVECVPTFGTSPGQVIGVIAGGQTAMFQAVEGAEDRAEDGRADLQAIGLNEKDIVIGIAASGRTPYVIGALDYAQEVHAETVGFSCNKQAVLSKHAHLAIEIEVGSEVLTGSTRLKAGTAQKKVLNMISTISMVQLGKVYQNFMVDVRVTNHKLAARATKILSETTGISLEAARKVLEENNYQLKPAIIMVQNEVDFAEAQAALASADGFVRKALK